MAKEPQSPLIPVYINQRIVFDLLSMLQDGIATVTKISERNQSQAAGSSDLDTSFGLNKAFSSLLAINLSGKRVRSTTDESGTTRDEERVHTPASLFFKLRELLDEKKFLKHDSSDFTPAPGDLIEFCSPLQRNPVIETMDIMASSMGMADAFNHPTQSKNKKATGKHDKAEGWQQKEMIRKLLEDLKSGGTIDLTSDQLSCGYRSVITAETASLNDPTMSDIVDGTFSVVGKIVRSVAKDRGAVNLMRKATLGRLAAKQLEEVFGHLHAIKQEHDFDLPDLIWKIDGPVMQVIPVAIFA